MSEYRYVHWYRCIGPNQYESLCGLRHLDTWLDRPVDRIRECPDCRRALLEARQQMGGGGQGG